MSTNFQGSAEAYEQLMGRWSRHLAPPFTRFSAIGDGATLLDVGCGTGSLTSALASAFPAAKIVGIDASTAFVEHARSRLVDQRISLERADATALPFPDGHFSASLSLLVLNFIPDREAAAREMARVTKSGGTVAAAVWDYYGGFACMRMLLDTAAAIDPAGGVLRSRVLSQPLTGSGDLAALWTRLGLHDVEQSSLTIRMEFRSFTDYWEPFLAGQGSAGPYVAGLDDERKDTLARHLRFAYLAGRDDGPRSFAATAWAVRGVR